MKRKILLSLAVVALSLIGLSCKFAVSPCIELFVNAATRNENSPKLGLLDRTGKIIVPANYFFIPGFDHGYSVAFKWSPGTPSVFDEVIIRKEGAAVLVSSKAGKYDEAGNYLVQCEKSGCSLINPAGKVIANGFDNYQGRFSNGNIVLHRNNTYYLVTSDGVPKSIPGCLEAKDTGLKQKLLPVRMVGGWGCIDATGKVIVPPKFSDVKVWCDGLVFVRHFGQTTPNSWCLFSNKQESCNPKFCDIGEMGTNLAIVAIQTTSGKCWGIVDESGKWILNPEYSGLELLRKRADQKTVVFKDLQTGKMGMINMQGRWILALKYSAINLLESEIAVVVEEPAGQKEKCTKLFWIASKKFSDCFGSLAQTGGGRLAFQNQGADKRYGLMSIDGTIIKEPTFKSIPIVYPTPENYIPASITNVLGQERWGWIDPQGNWIIEPSYAEARIFAEEAAACAIEKNGEKQWGWINKKKQWLIEPRYAKAREFNQGLAEFGLNARACD